MYLFLVLIIDLVLIGIDSVILFVVSDFANIFDIYVKIT